MSDTPNNSASRATAQTVHNVPKMPDHLRRLHAAVEKLRARSYETIELNDDLSRHVALIEHSMDLLFACSANPEPGETEDQRVIRLLGMRLFNGCAAAFDLLVAGYYQHAGMIMRDLLETVFLLGYLDMDRARIEKWRNADGAARQRDFAPVKVRIALDERDGFTEKKREASYKLLCELAAHPSYQGFAMLKPAGLDHHHCGPFFESTANKALIEELVKLAMQAASNLSIFFRAKTPPQRKAQLNYLETSGQWAEQFYHRPFDRAGFEKLKAEAKELGLIP